MAEILPFERPRFKTEIEKIEYENRDLELEIIQNVYGDYDIYMFGIVKYRNVPSLKEVKKLRELRWK